jgi:thioredoxin 1
MLMSSAHIVEINDLNFQHEVLEAREPVLLDFTASWCGPCRSLAPIVDSIANEHHGRVKVGKVDADESPHLASRLGVRGFPTVVVFSAGREVSRHLGVAKRATLLAMLPDAPLTDRS